VSFLVASVVLSILQVGATEIFKLQIGYNCNLLGARRPQFSFIKLQVGRN
jgi:hypothetical protein